MYDLNNSERLLLLRHVNSEARKAEKDKSVTLAKLTRLYDLQRKLSVQIKAP